MIPVLIIGVGLLILYSVYGGTGLPASIDQAAVIPEPAQPLQVTTIDQAYQVYAEKQKIEEEQLKTKVTQGAIQSIVQSGSLNPIEEFLLKTTVLSTPLPPVATPEPVVNPKTDYLISANYNNLPVNKDTVISTPVITNKIFEPIPEVTRPKVVPSAKITTPHGNTNRID
jgi:hypothetical protein